MTRIIHITDLHFWRIVHNPLLLLNKRFLGNLNLALRRQYYVCQDRAKSFIDLFSSLNADVLLVGGDMTTTATASEYEMAAAFINTLGQSGIPVYMTPGNHDFYTFEAVRHKRFQKYFGERMEHPEIPRLAYLPGGMPLLILPTAQPNLLSSRGHITPHQILEARKLIEEAPDGHMVVLAHYPILSNPAHHANCMRTLDNAAPLRRMLGDTGRPLLYLAGHVHVSTHDRDPRFPNLEQITTSALFYDKQHCPGGFTEVIIDKEAVMIHPWRFENGWKRQENNP